MDFNNIYLLQSQYRCTCVVYCIFKQLQNCDDQCGNCGFDKCCGCCFSSIAEISLVNGRSVKMSELKKGDRIRSGRDN